MCRLCLEFEGCGVYHHLLLCIRALGSRKFLVWQSTMPTDGIYARVFSRGPREEGFVVLYASNLSTMSAWFVATTGKSFVINPSAWAAP